MGKMGMGQGQGKRLPDVEPVTLKRRAERNKLRIGQGMEKGFEQHQRFAQAGVEVKMVGIQSTPFAFRMKEMTFVESANCREVAISEIFHHIR